MKSLNHIKDAVRIVFSSRKHIFIAVVIFIAFFVLYIFTLPATYTGGRVGIISLRMLTPLQGAFAFVMALFISLIVPFTIYAFKMGRKAKKASTATGFIASVLPPILCCSPLLPTLVATLGAVSPIFGFSSSLQGFIATNATYILLGATLLLVYALVQTAKSTKECLC